MIVGKAKMFAKRDPKDVKMKVVTYTSPTRPGSKFAMLQFSYRLGARDVTFKLSPFQVKVVKEHLNHLNEFQLANEHKSWAGLKTLGVDVSEVAPELSTSPAEERWDDVQPAAVAESPKPVAPDMTVSTDKVKFK